jgi:hypothetical protein
MLLLPGLLMSLTELPACFLFPACRLLSAVYYFR